MMDRIRGGKVTLQTETKLLPVKKEPKLISDSLIATRKCRQLELEKVSGTYDFSVVPNSMFTGQSQPLPLGDEAKVFQEIKSSILKKHSNSANYMDHMIIFK